MKQFSNTTISRNIFRAYDIRAVYPGEINEKITEEIVKGLLQTAFKKAKKIVVARDARLSSPALYKAVLGKLKIENCLSRSGSRSAIRGKLKIINVGLSTTPMFYFLVNHYKADAGIMITASHNPKNHNGLKVVGKNAVPISGTEIRRQIFKS